MAGAPHNIITLYKEWVNSILCEAGLQIQSISNLSSSHVLHLLYKTLTRGKVRFTNKLTRCLKSLNDIHIQLIIFNHAIDYHEMSYVIINKDVYKLESTHNLNSEEFDTDNIGLCTNILRKLRADGIRIHIQPSDILGGDILSLLELIWALILHYTIHIPGEVRSHQRTLSIGTKLLLQWSSEILGGACFDYRLSMNENMEKDILHNLINKVTGLVSSDIEPEPCDYHEAIAEAERKLGISSNLLRASDSYSEDLAVTVYVALLRRKSELVIKGVPPTLPCTLLNQESQSTSPSFHALAEYNGRTQQVLQELERQLGKYQTGRASATMISSTGVAPHTETQDSIRKKLDLTDDVEQSVANGVSDKEAMDLKLDLLQMKNQRSKATSSTPKMNGGGETGYISGHSDFSELFKQIKQKEMGSHTRPVSHQLIVNTEQDKNQTKDDDDNSTSPKSAPTDEGFGTFTKTTPRDKDSAASSEVSSADHTDVDVDHLEAGETEEAGSITEWWDKLEMPVELATPDTFLVKSAAEHPEMNRFNSDGSFEFHEDELMFMIDNIGMTGMKASSSLASAKETELRLLRILKERDDLVLSYHTALKELSRLATRIKDENHMLRTQLNMNDLSHSEIVLALEEQASSGRQLALSIQDDLTDTEVNVVSRLREDKLALEDRLAALEDQYNSDITWWKSELASCRCGRQKDTEITSYQEAVRENTLLKQQINDMRQVFDRTITQTQEECNNYLKTIEELKDQLLESKSPVSESQIEALAARQSEMEKLYESMIGSLEVDNSNLQIALEELQVELGKLTAKPDQSKSVGTDNLGVDKSVDAGINYTSNKQCGTSDHQSWANKSMETEEDSRLVSMKEAIKQLDGKLSQSQTENQTLTGQRNELLNNHKQVCDRLAEMESQLQSTHHKLTTLQAVHELVLTKNETLERLLKDDQAELASMTSNSYKLKTRLTAELQTAQTSSSHLIGETRALQEKISQLQSENSLLKQREIELNSEITQLTLERSNLQTKVNSLNADMVQQKAQSMSQNLRLKQLEASNSKLQQECSVLKEDSMGIVDQLQKAQMVNDSLTSDLDSAKQRLQSDNEQWQTAFQRKDREYQLIQKELEKSKQLIHTVTTNKSSLSTQVEQLTRQLRDAEKRSETDRLQLLEVLKTAKLDSNAEDALEQLNEQLKTLKQQVAEFQFTTTYFRTENSRLQQKVNHLEELNRSVEKRKDILQNELSHLQTSLDESFQSQDDQLNLLDLSSSELSGMNDASELRKYLVAAKKQVTNMQAKRAKANADVTKSSSEKELTPKDLMNSHSETASVVPQQKSAAQSDLWKTEPSSHQNSHLSASVLATHSTPSATRPSIGSTAETLHTDDLEEEADSLSLKVRSLTGDTYTSAYQPSKLSVPNEHHTSLQQQQETGDSNHMAEIEKENASLREELRLINSDRASLHQRLEDQTGHHDELNETLEELERSLDEIHNSNQILKTTLQNSNDFIQQNLLEGDHRYRSTSSAAYHSNQRTMSPLQLRSLTPHVTSSGFSSSYRTRDPYRSPSAPPARLSQSLYNPPPVATLSTETPTSDAHKTEGSGVDGNYERLGWSVQSDRHLTSSVDFNRLQQTNVQNYESLLESDTNMKSPDKRLNTSTRKSSDLNKMIRHSLTQLNHVTSPPATAADSPYSTHPSRLQNVMTSTPLKSRTNASSLSSYREYNSESFTTSKNRYYTANEHSTATPKLQATKTSPKANISSKHSHIKSPDAPSYSSSVRYRYNDGGPGPYEPKTVLPEPKIPVYRNRYSSADTDDI